MWVPFFYFLNIVLLLGGLIGFRLGSVERRFSLALVQVLLSLPLLAGEYFYLTTRLTTPASTSMVLFSEIIFTLIWLALARHLHQTTAAVAGTRQHHFFLEIGIGATVAAAAAYFLIYHSVPRISDDVLTFPIYSPVYFAAVFTLITVLYAAWRLEQFWHALNSTRRWEYKFFMVGSYLVCGGLAWQASYRLTYLTIAPHHLQLLATLLLCGWLLVTYAVTHHRLLNRKIFVSRKVIYSFVVPSLLAAYLLGFGVITLIMRTFGMELTFVLKWLCLALGFSAVGLFIFSGKIRRRIHFFISTHFYINKYEYRDEWLALSEHLQGARTENDVVKALRQVLVDSLYTTDIFIWIGDTSRGYRLVSSPGSFQSGQPSSPLAPDDLLVSFIQNHSHFHLNEPEPDKAWHAVMTARRSFLTATNLSLIVPIAIGGQLTGLIGLGPEFTGGVYGHDDFDLLTALGSQTASALLAVCMAEELANTREQQAWNRLSAFVLHDIKNAATMLAMLRENAPEHIHEPEFQQDMLELVGDTLKRMGRVEHRLGTLKDEIHPDPQDMNLGRFLADCRRRLTTTLPSMDISIEGGDEIRVHTDPALLFSVMENLILNAFEAGGNDAAVHIRIDQDQNNRQAIVDITDNGPGIAPDLLPDRLFEPFKTTKDGGSGIGLWQAKRVAVRLGGNVSASNTEHGGARFVIQLPLSAAME